MTRLIPLALLAIPLVAIAAPVPPESDRSKIARLWGTVESPPGKYGVTLDGKQLTLRTLGWPLGFEYKTPTFGVWREVAGDFDVRVKLVSLDAPNRHLRHEGKPEVAAGLFIDGGEVSLSLHHWMAIHSDNQGQLYESMQSCVWRSMQTPNGGGSYLKELEACQSVYLRVTREGKVVATHASTDGENWESWPSDDLALPASVRIGVFVGHTTSQEVAAVFSDFTVGKPEKVKK